MDSSAMNSQGEKSYYAVIFAAVRNDSDHEEYARVAKRMVELAKAHKGFLGMESVRGADGFGITISYWQTLEDIQAWKANSEHMAAQELGRSKWYRSYRVRICKVEREYAFSGGAN